MRGLGPSASCDYARQKRWWKRNQRLRELSTRDVRPSLQGRGSASVARGRSQKQASVAEQSLPSRRERGAAGPAGRAWLPGVRDPRPRCSRRPRVKRNFQREETFVFPGDSPEVQPGLQRSAISGTSQVSPRPDARGWHLGPGASASRQRPGWARAAGTTPVFHTQTPGGTGR